jgi:Protein of unknown function (DUF1566)
MKRGLSCMSAVVVMAMVGGAASLSEAQNGPYYAVPSWDQTLACPSTTNCPRFIVVMGGAAVLDRETGLVWEKSPLALSLVDWRAPLFQCPRSVVVGNRRGWRLPTIQELSSLIDLSVPLTGPTLPAGHPFIGVQTSHRYWSATTVLESGGSAWVVDFGTGGLDSHEKSDSLLLRWCVRGGHSPDAQ